MATTYGMSDEDNMSVGRVFALAAETVRHNSGVTLAIALVFGTVPQLPLTYGSARIEAAQASELAVGAVFLSLLVLMLVMQTIALAILSHVTVAGAHDRKPSMAACVQAALSVALPLLGVAFIMALGIMVGFVLLIVPGILLYVIWAVAGPVLVAERQGAFAALGRSAELTRGSRWKVFGVSAVVIVGTLFAGGAVEAILGSDDAAASYADPVYVIATAIATTATILLAGTVQAAMYVELRDLKDGPAAARLQEVFA